MKNKNILTILFLMLILTVISCGNSNKKSDRIDAVEKEVVKAPEFNADSDYAYVRGHKRISVRRAEYKAHEDAESIWLNNWKSLEPRFITNVQTS